MKFNYDENPNTVKFWDYYYFKRKVERKSLWLFDTVLYYLKTFSKPDALEIGCGAGRTIIELWKLKKDVNWTGLDFSATAIDKAIHKYGKYAKFTCQDIVVQARESDPVPQYDFILCSETLEHISDPPLVCRHMWKMLRLGGIILITVPVAGTPLDTGKLNLHHITFVEQDFRDMFSRARVNVFQIDKHHMCAIIKKGESE